MWWAKLEKAVHTFIVWELTLIRGSEREVHMAISSRVLMSGYLFLANSASNSWSCCEVKWVRCRLWRLSFTLFLLLLLLLLFLPLFEFVDDLTWSLVSSSWLSGLSGLWLGSRDPGSEIIKKIYRLDFHVYEVGGLGFESSLSGNFLNTLNKLPAHLMVSWKICPPTLPKGIFLFPSNLR